MRVNIDCECIILSETLRLFCKNFASSKAECDFIISDSNIKSTKPVFIISKDSPHLKIPFTKEMLLESMQDFYSAIQVRAATSKTSSKSNKDVEQMIIELCDNFKHDLIQILRSNK